VSGLDFATGIMDCFQERHPADFVVFSYSKELKIKEIAVKAYENSP
jgi:hypothetical protein